ncbi:hypothetical protein GCM10009799_28060 [Nocardiopsis rhodophaea]|uniref:DUF397 domain-containing protein n=1 Tax=Nocardiopsis rhodophaea TaxID=280238 RepID=A0ABN2T5X0_9ACTN
MNANTEFRKSSYSAQNQNCVEVANLRRIAAIRDSKHAEKGYLTFPSGEWAIFLTASRRGEL